jgi:hypothetical protein
MSPPATPHADPLTLALVEALVFLELSDEETVDPDSAVRVMETIARCLQRLDGGQRAAFHQQLALIAGQEGHDELGRQRREYIKAIPEYLGIEGG